MSKRNLIVWLVMGLCWMVLPAKASGLGDIRVHARFLTDRMAFELNLNQYQYDDLYEVNFDFLCGIDPYINDLAYSRVAAMDAYYRYLDERNDDLRWILSSAEYLRFMALDYFFRPIYAVNHCCYLRVYQIYPNRTFFYFGRPRHYLTYRGAHSRFHCGGRSYYREHFGRRYTHAVYGGYFRARPDFRKHDFGPGARPGVRPGRVPTPKPGGPGYHLHRWVRNRVIVRVDRRRTVREIAPISRRQTVRQTIREILLRLSVRTDRLTVRRLGVVRRLGAVRKLVESQKSGNVRRVRNARRIVEM